MTRKIKTKQLIHTFLFLLSLLLRGLKVPSKAGGSQVSQGEATQDYLPLENTSSWKIQRKMVLWQLFVSLSSVSHLHGELGVVAQGPITHPKDPAPRARPLALPAPHLAVTGFLSFCQRRLLQEPRSRSY